MLREKQKSYLKKMSFDQASIPSYLVAHFYTITNLTLIHISELHVLFSTKDQVHSYI